MFQWPAHFTEHPAFAGVPHHRSVPLLPYTFSCATSGTLVRTCVQPRMRVERLFFATRRDCSTVHVHFGLYIIVRERYWFTSRTGVELFRVYKRVYMNPLCCLTGVCKRDTQRRGTGFVVVHSCLPPPPPFFCCFGEVKLRFIFRPSPFLAFISQTVARRPFSLPCHIIV